MKKHIASLLVVGLLLAGLATVPYLAKRSVEQQIGSQHIFELSDSLGFLSDQLALVKARDTLTQDGYNVAIWRPRYDGRTMSPDGSIDEFLSRNTVTPTRGSITFTSTIAGPRFVSVELVGSRIICQTSIGK